MNLNGKPIHDFRPEFTTMIGVHPKGYRVFHIGVAFEDEGVRVLHEFMEAQCPFGFHKARVPVAEFDGDLSRARLAACFALAQLMTNDPVTGDLRPEFDTEIGRSDEGYRLRHLGIGRFEGTTRFLDEFVQADSRDDHHFRIDLRLTEGDIDAAKVLAIHQLSQYIASLATA